MVPRFVGNQRSIEFLNAGLLVGESELSLAHDQTTLERSLRRLLLRIDRKADGTYLHFDDRVMAIAPPRRGGQTGDVLGSDV